MVNTSDLAKLYECANGTKTINLAVKKHIKRFPERFMFQLTKEETFNNFEEKAKYNSIFFEGQIYDAYSVLIDILNKGKKEIIIVDNYAGKELLDILKDINRNITIISKNINENLEKSVLL